MFIVDGEELVGAKQDYAVNVTITSLVGTSIYRTLSVWPSHGVLAGEHPPENAMRFFLVNTADRPVGLSTFIAGLL